MGGLFKKDKPKPTPVQRMPDPEDPAAKEAERRKAMAIQQRSGRASTVLSRKNSNSSGTNAGTAAYGNSLLGQAN